MQTKGKKTKYILTLSEEQARLLSSACEFYARMRMGQWNELIWHCIDMSRDDFCKRRDEAEKLLLEARKQVYPELFPSVGHSYGVGRFEDADDVWAIYEVLRNKIAWHDHPEGGWSVCFDEPRSWTGKPLAECEVKNYNSYGIESLGLSVRAYNCLMRAGVKTVEQLEEMTDDDLLRVRNLGQRAFQEIKDKLKESR